MLSMRVNDITVRFDRDGDRNFNRSGMVDWHGKPVFVLSAPYSFHFDLEGRIQRIDGFPSPYSWDWVQRTMANDWIYYDRVWEPGKLPEPSGIIGDSAWAINGRTDLPMLQRHEGLAKKHVRKALEALDSLMASIQEMVKDRPCACRADGSTATPDDAERLWAFLAKVAMNDRGCLEAIAERLAGIRGRMNVLPPDAITVDYTAILIKVMDGCTNACGFCVARGDSPMAIRSEDDIDRQIEASAEVYGADLPNHNSVVLGECDALVSPSVEYAARRAYEVFRCGDSYHSGSNLLLFTTNKTLCGLSENTFDTLQALPYTRVAINVGWEAATDEALAQLRKQATAAEVMHGLEIAGRLNRRGGRVRISGNFITQDEADCSSIADAIRRSGYCGQLYLSPLRGQCSSNKALEDLALLRRTHPDVRVHLYTMQRL